MSEVDHLLRNYKMMDVLLKYINVGSRYHYTYFKLCKPFPQVVLFALPGTLHCKSVLQPRFFEVPKEKMAEENMDRVK